MSKKQVPVREGLFTWGAEGPQLIGSRCTRCREVTFPEQQICPNCCTQTMERLLLSRRGKLYSFTIQRHQPPPPYRGPDPFTPYGAGEVELPEGVIITSVLTESNPEALKIGMEMELVIERFFDDGEGNEVVCYKFKPVSKY